MRKFLVLLMLLGCAGCTNLRHTQTNQLTICKNQQCHSMETSHTEKLFADLQKMLQTNNGKASICTADTNSHKCQKVKVCHFVLGGMLPGNGCANQITFSKITAASSNKLTLQADMPLNFISTPVKCKTADASFSLDSDQQFSLKLEPHFCSWMVMGVMTATLDFHIDWIDLDTKKLAGYWAHSVKGTGNGSGSGYMLLQFSDY